MLWRASAPAPVDLDTGKVRQASVPRGQETHQQQPRQPAVHAERVTLSDEAREASREASPPVLSDVRWYRVVNSQGRRTIAASEDAAAPAGAEAFPPPPTVLQAHPRAALRAYTETMALAA